MQRLLRLVAILALVFSLLTFNAFPGDSLMYHLPFAIRFWHLHSWPDFTGYFEDRYQGFPILWRVLLGPGLFFKAPRLFVLPNLLALAGLCWCARKYLFLSWPSTVLACLCFPVALYGFASSMQDFFMNCTALSGALCLFSANLQSKASETQKAWLVGLSMLALSANIKHHGFILSAIILALAFIFSWPIPWSAGLARSRLLFASSMRICGKSLLKLAVITLLLLALFAQPVINTYRFHNPFFPAAFWLFKGSEGSNISTIPYVPKIPLVYNGITFLSSALEIDPVLRSSRGLFFRRSVHMQNPPESDRQPADQFGNRWIITGGSNGILYAVVLLAAVLTLLRNQRLPLPEMDPRDRRLLRLQNRLMLSLLLTVLLPQTLELRYYMYNLFVPCFVAVSSPWRDLRRFVSLVTVIAAAFAMLATIAAPLYFWWRTSTWSHESVSWDVLHAVPAPQACVHTLHQFQAVDLTSANVPIGTAKAVVLCGFHTLHPALRE